MKLPLLAIVAALGIGLAARADEPKPAAPAAADKAAGDEHDHDHDHKAKAGPNGGRLITSVEPHIEFLVNKENKIELRLVDDDNKVLPPGDATIAVTLGERTKPVKLAFSKSGDTLVSDGKIPEGNNYPVVVQIRADAKAKPVNEKFNLNLSDCPTCEHKEYACICDHGDDDHDHDHKDEKK